MKIIEGRVYVENGDVLYAPAWKQGLGPNVLRWNRSLREPRVARLVVFLAGENTFHAAEEHPHGRIDGERYPQGFSPAEERSIFLTHLEAARAGREMARAEIAALRDKLEHAQRAEEFFKAESRLWDGMEWRPEDDPIGPRPGE